MEYLKNKKDQQFQKLLILRGHERIRTAVTGFADRGLATRPRDLIGLQNYKISQYKRIFLFYSFSNSLSY